MSRPHTPFPPATPELRRSGFADRACVRCGWRFFTTAGLLGHEGECDGAPTRCVEVQTVATRKRRQLTYDGRANLQERGLALAALNNARRFRCGGCDKVSTPAGIGLHQSFTGHAGRTELT